MYQDSDPRSEMLYVLYSSNQRRLFPTTLCLFLQCNNINKNLFNLFFSLFWTALTFSITYICRRLYSFLGIWRHTSRNLSLNWRVYTPLVIHIRKWFLTTFLWCVEASPWHWALSNFIFALLTCVFFFFTSCPFVFSMKTLHVEWRYPFFCPNTYTLSFRAC